MISKINDRQQTIDPRSLANIKQDKYQAKPDQTFLGISLLKLQKIQDERKSLKEARGEKISYL